MANEEKSFLDETGLSHLWSKLKLLLAGKEASGAAATVQGNLDTHTGNTSNPHKVTKAQVGLGNVNNTSDADKPVSTAQAAAIADAKKAGTDAQANLTSHNTDTAAHNDLRTELKALSDRIAAVLDSDDETLDELSEIVAYIKSNKELIEAITTSKVSVTDIVNDLVTNVANKPLSAAQGVALKKLIDDIATSLNNLVVQTDWNQNDSTKDGFIKNRPFYETDPVEVVIAEGTIPAGGYLQVPTTIKSLTLGETYTVVFDGITYSNLTCISVDGLPAIGSADFSYTDYPFVFGVQNGMTIGMAGDGSSHTMRVTGSATEIIPLDRKYIADHIDNFPGEKVDGKVYTIDEESVTAGVGAEVFNNYAANIASGGYAHAEGSNTTASGTWSSHAEGYGTKATASYSHAEGRETTASGTSAHSEGHSTVASNDAAHAEGFGTEASGKYSHAEGDNTHATAQATHAEGSSAYATANYAHAEGRGTKASSEAQHVQGKFNVEDTAGKYAHIVGNGNTGNDRSNAHTVDWDGNGWFKGDVYIGGTGQSDASALNVRSQINQLSSEIADIKSEIPVKGIDYWTPEDQESIVQDVILALGMPVFGSVTAENDIMLTGALAVGTYAIKYEDEAGNVAAIGNLTLRIGSLNVPLTWEHGVELNKTNGKVVSTNNSQYSASGYVEIDPYKTYTLTRESYMYNACTLIWYDENNDFVRYDDISFASINASGGSSNLSYELVPPANATKFRLRLWYETTQNAATVAALYKLEKYGVIVDDGTGDDGTGDSGTEEVGMFDASTCQINKRTNSSGNVSDNTGTFLTDFIDLGDAMASGGTNTLHYKGMYFNTSNWTGSYVIYSYICYYDADKKFIANEDQRTAADVVTADGDYTKVLNAAHTTARYIRITASILPNPSSSTAIAALTSKDQLANCKLALNETITD